MPAPVGEMHGERGSRVKPAPDAQDPLTRLDQLVGAAPEPENTVLTDDARLVRWAGPSFLLFSLLLLPWIGYIAASLPARQLSPNYDVAWAGFDVFLLAGLASTAYFALRRSRYLSTAAAATATLLVVDAWFDCMTTPADQRWQSFVLCGLVELPLAALCLWLSYHTHQIAERRIRLLLAAAAAPAARIAVTVAASRNSRLPMHEDSARGHLGGGSSGFRERETVMSSSSARVSMKARRASDSRPAQLLARAGLTARGVIYILIGIVAFLVAVGQGGHQADQQGALQLVAAQPFGLVLLWLLAIGFVGYALWRFSEAAFGVPGEGTGAGPRLKSLVRGLVYASFAVLTFKVITGKKSNQAGQEKDFTASVMHHTGGRFAVGIVGLIIVIVGLALVVEGARHKFMKHLRTGEMSPQTRKMVQAAGHGGDHRPGAGVRAGRGAGHRRGHHRQPVQGGRPGHVPAHPAQRAVR